MDLEEIKENYDSMNWEDFRDCAGDLVQREIDIYDKAIINDFPKMLKEIKKLRKALEFYANNLNWDYELLNENNDYEELIPEALVYKSKVARKALGIK